MRLTHACVAAMCVLLTTTAAAQSLAQLAGQEAARRKALSEPVRVYTNADLTVWRAPTPPVTPPFPGIEPPRESLFSEPADHESGSSAESATAETPQLPMWSAPTYFVSQRGGRTNAHVRNRRSGEGLDKFVTGNPRGLPPRGERADKFAVDHAFRSPGDRFRGGAGTPHARDERPPVADRPAAPSRPHPRSEVVASSPVAVGKPAADKRSLK